MRSNGTSHCRFGMIILALLVSVARSAPAQSPRPTPTPAPSSSPAAPATRSLEKDFFKNILQDQKAIWTSPLHLKSEDARWLVPLGVGTAALIATDQSTGDEIAESDKPLNASRIVSYPGSSYGVGAIAGAFYIFGRARHNSRARETGVLGAEALIDSVIVSSSIKAITQRTRPNGGRSRSDFFDGGTSFPSGHSIQAWTLATIIANEYHDQPAVQIAAYGIASAVSVARFTGRNHYLSDVLIGSVMGYGIGQYVYHKRHRKTVASGGSEEEESRDRSRWPAIAPQYNRRAHDYGVALAWSF
jgi:membrane-associated phospholipid phosphatase